MINVKMRKIRIIANKIDCIVRDLYDEIETDISTSVCLERNPKHSLAK